MFLIGEFSKITQVSKRLLHHYDKIGLFCPSYINQNSGYRYYKAEQISRLNKILALKELGLSLDQVKKMISEDISHEEIQGMLKIKKAEIEQSLDKEKSKLRKIEVRLSVDKNSLSSPEVIIKKLPSSFFLSSRKTCSSEMELLSFTNTIFEDLPLLVPNTIQGNFYAIVHTKEFDLEKNDVEFGLLLKKDLKEISYTNSLSLGVRELEAVDMAASAVLSGSYDPILEGLQYIAQWIEENNYQINGPYRELILKLPPNGDIKKTIIEIQIPIIDKTKI